MLVADTYLGHRDDPAVADRLSASDPERVVLSDTDRRRSRVRTETVDGRDLGVVVAPDLDDGDVLETRDDTLVVVQLAATTALVVEFADADVSTTGALEIGHALGNRHWDLAVRGTEALLPVTNSRERMEAVLADCLPDGASTRFEAVPPTTFDDSPNHGHEHGKETSAHAHPHGHEHDHTDHDHGGDGHAHARDGGVRPVGEDNP